MRACVFISAVYVGPRPCVYECSTTFPVLSYFRVEFLHISSFVVCFQLCTFYFNQFPHFVSFTSLWNGPGGVKETNFFLMMATIRIIRLPPTPSFTTYDSLFSLRYPFSLTSTTFFAFKLKFFVRSNDSMAKSIHERWIPINRESKLNEAEMFFLHSNRFETFELVGTLWPWKASHQ